MTVLVGGVRLPEAAHAEETRWQDTSHEELLGLATTVSLMGDTHTLLFVGALGGVRSEEFFDLAEALVTSPHHFIFEEEKLLKRPQDILRKAGAVLHIAPTQKKEATFDVFSLANTFALRDRKKFWLLLTQGLTSGAAPEAIAGMLHWKVRTMLGEGKTGKYTKDELAVISRELVVLYHESHRGGGDLALLLERFALKL